MRVCPQQRMQRASTTTPYHRILAKLKFNTPVWSAITSSIVPNQTPAARPKVYNFSAKNALGVYYFFNHVMIYFMLHCSAFLLRQEKHFAMIIPLLQTVMLMDKVESTLNLTQHRTSLTQNYLFENKNLKIITIPNSLSP